MPSRSWLVSELADEILVLVIPRVGGKGCAGVGKQLYQDVAVVYGSSGMEETG